MGGAVKTAKLVLYSCPLLHEAAHRRKASDRLGGLMDGLNFLKQCYYPTLKKAGLQRIRFHYLRHTAATLLLRQGVNPKVVSEMLGHASVAITLDIYSHVLLDMLDAAEQTMEMALF